MVNRNATGQVWAGIMLVLMLGIGALMLQSFQDTVDNTTDAYTIIGDGLTGLGELGDLATLIFVMIGLAIIVSLFYFFQSSGQ
jgi:hypothetical protein